MKIEEISASEYEAGVINTIAKEYPSFRQESKAPT